jgi:hypothetical protein
VTRAGVDDPHQNLGERDGPSEPGHPDHPHLDTDETSSRKLGGTQEAELVEVVPPFGEAPPREDPHVEALAQLLGDAAQGRARSVDRVGREIAQAPGPEERNEHRAIEKHQIRRVARKL